MLTKESIQQQVFTVIHELFDHPLANIQGDLRLYEDLDIDSIDAVDMVVKLKEITGRKIAPSDFKDVRKVDDIVDAVVRLLEAGEPAN